MQLAKQKVPDSGDGWISAFPSSSCVTGQIPEGLTVLSSVEWTEQCLLLALLRKKLGNVGRARATESRIQLCYLYSLPESR